MHTTRRQFTTSLAASAASLGMAPSLLNAKEEKPFELTYMLASCMYGYADLATILAEMPKLQTTHLDIWPKVHGNQREQLGELGEQEFAELLTQHKVQLSCITQYKLGPFGLQEEMQLAKRLGCTRIVTGAVGPTGLSGADLKSAIQAFLEKLKPHLAVAESCNVTIAIENHGKSLIDSPDAIKWLVELSPSKNLGVAFAPYHLPQDSKLLADLLRSIGPALTLFYAWQHGHGCMEKLPKEEELLQLPGHGSLDFAPLLKALKEIQFRGLTEVFMHPFPRGIAILDTPAAVTTEINRSRAHLTSLLANG